MVHVLTQTRRLPVSVRCVQSLGVSVLFAITMAISVLFLSTSKTSASTLELKTAFLARSPLVGPNATRTVVRKNENGAYAAMINRSVHLERGIDPASGLVQENVPNYFTSLDASASDRGFRIQNRMSLAQIPVGTFPKPSDPNYFTLNRTDYTGYAGVGLTDTLLITGSTENQGKEGRLNMSFRIFGTRSVLAPAGTTVGATVCPKLIGASGCSPMGAPASSRSGTFDNTFNYTFPFTFDTPFSLNMPFYSWIFVNEPTTGERYCPASVGNGISLPGS